MFRHGYTYSGHAAVAAAALANLDIMRREDLCGRAASLEKELEAALAPLSDHPLVEEVRSGTGVLAAVQLSAAGLAADATLVGHVVAAARAAGVLTRALVSGALQISPALVIDAEGLDELAAGLRSALDACV
jgi:putrescine---pyruvate transaminase